MPHLKLSDLDLAYAAEAVRAAADVARGHAGSEPTDEARRQYAERAHSLLQLAKRFEAARQHRHKTYREIYDDI